MMRPSFALPLVIAALPPGAALRSQHPDNSVRVALGFGVDTLGTSREIFSLWRNYRSSGPGGAQQSPLGAASERAQWPAVDLLCGFVYQGFSRFTVVHLAPAVGLDSTYMIRTLVATVSDSVKDVYPLALYRVYATREQGRWVLANALPRLTRDWNHERIGRVQF